MAGVEADADPVRFADARESAIADAYREIASLIGATPRNIGIVANATAGFIQAMSSFDFARGDVIVTTRSDYTSHQIQFLALSQRLGVQVLHADDLPEGGVDPESVRALAAHPKCRLVHVSWVPTHSGLVQDVEAVGAVCEGLGVPYLVDACQAVGQIPIDVTSLRCDYLAVTARKFLRGPRGVGFLYASDRALARGDHPLFVDMRGARWIDASTYELADSAIRFEDGSLPTLWCSVSPRRRYARATVPVAQRELGLAENLRSQLSSIDGVRVLDRGSVRSAIVTAEIPGWHAPDLVSALRERRINSAATLRWYGLLDLTPRNVTSAIRLSPHYYNTEDEISATVDAIRELSCGV
jgi:selenocysteine lyase/cysteine desulfurase